LIPKRCLVNGIKLVAAGYEHSLFIKKNGSLLACGNNDKRQLIFNDDAKVILEPQIVPY
jgi:alpha-tubulin suppressor-like RCC1 family protein